MRPLWSATQGQKKSPAGFVVFFLFDPDDKKFYHCRAWTFVFISPFVHFVLFSSCRLPMYKIPSRMFVLSGPRHLFHNLRPPTSFNEGWEGQEKRSIAFHMPSCCIFPLIDSCPLKVGIPNIFRFTPSPLSQSTFPFPFRENELFSRLCSSPPRHDE